MKNLYSRPIKLLLSDMDPDSTAKDSRYSKDFYVMVISFLECDDVDIELYADYFELYRQNG